ncbi:Phage gp6-like head-tail connector protein [Clostridium amylolyticum]|uniref:Phage gp6-like head-tail connector protein n=1 Tax=Clostridium amylolyticum TaxID=1121298 RepID=A0A1M6EXQ4_9CLOT|nr:phage head-tail connector protein [Clostridium amylolyticum]SHI90161.1 Phage gp6-like head-tail connector protein [Clostridium amylolyticum]
MLNKIKIALQMSIADTSKDDLLNLMVEDVQEFILNYCNIKELPGRAESLIRRIVVIRYNTLGSEGLSSESYSGISQSFIDGLPKDIKQELGAIRKVKF